ncbi:MAG: hypothetical protein C0592_05255 [Marinilabiliales bacterium]|nr:MAG: hypothetical protein C0592_05255 [Marinilabiliales bacterium]
MSTAFFCARYLLYISAKFRNMKYYIFLCFFLFSIQVFSQNKSAEPLVDAVTVYLTGAEIHSVSTIDVSKGKSKIVFTGLSPVLDPKSIQISVEPADVTILSVSSRTNYLSGKSDNSQIKLLKDSLEMLNDELTLIQFERETYTKEKDLLFKNQSIGGTENGVAVEEIEKSADFFRARSTEINELLFKINKREANINEQIARISRQLSELNAQYNPPSSEIEVSLMSPRAGKLNFDISYMVFGCGWAPKYDVRVEGVSHPVNLIYRANLFNNSGVDWNDVKLKLSTAEPGKSASKPVLTKWSLNYASDVQDYSVHNELNMDQRITVDEDMEGNGPVGYETVQVDELAAEFEIKTPYTILSDSKTYTVDVNEFDLPATYESYCVPKMDRDAFLLARFTNWSQLNLVSGNASVYFAGTYIGQTMINTASVADTMSVSLGRDRKIIVKRTQKMEESKRQVVGGSMKETFMYEIIIRNNREAAVKITVQDQVPVSQNNDIDVDILEISGAKHDELSGILTWVLTIPPGETKSLILSYSIKYPKNMNVNKKRYRSVQNPKFF